LKWAGAAYLSRPRVQRTLDAVSGTVLLGFAVRLMRSSTA
jgi:threonine/homoserine/homoserine lactone efflux protein